MKTVTIDLNNKEKLILVEVPIDAKDFTVRIFDIGISPEFLGLHYRVPERNFIEQLPPNIKFESILGTYLPRTGVINFNDLVKCEWVEPRSRLTDTYTDYTQEMSVGFQDYEDSFISLLKTETEKAFPLKENPYPKRPKIIRGQYAVMENESLTEAIDNTNKFNESESKVMPHKFVVLKSL